MKPLSDGKTAKSYVNILRKSGKTSCFDPFFQQISTPRFFIKNPASSVSAHYCSSTSCQVSLRFYDRFFQRYWLRTNGRTNGRMNERGPIYRTNLLESVAPINGIIKKNVEEWEKNWKKIRVSDGWDTPVMLWQESEFSHKSANNPIILKLLPEKSIFE